MILAHTSLWRYRSDVQCRLAWQQSRDSRYEPDVTQLQEMFCPGCRWARAGAPDECRCCTDCRSLSRIYESLPDIGFQAAQHKPLSDQIVAAYQAAAGYKIPKRSTDAPRGSRSLSQ